MRILKLWTLLGIFGFVLSSGLFANGADNCVSECLDDNNSNTVDLRDDDDDNDEHNDDDDDHDGHNDEEDRSYDELTTTATLINDTNEVSLRVGANLIGFSTQTNASNMYALCTGIKSFYTFDANLKQWTQGSSATNIAKGQGAYVYSDGACQFAPNEIVSTNEFLVSLVAGWNLVGTSIAVDNFKSWDSSCVQSIYANYQHTEKSYHLDSKSGALQVIAPYEGFFVLAKKDCTINIANSSPTDSSVPTLPSAPTTTATQTTSSFNVDIYYAQNCASCHSKTDRDIKGKSYARLLSELKVYQQNRGEVRKMNEVLSPVSDADLETLAQYLAAF